MHEIIRTKEKKQCICCQSEGHALYGKLKDRLFGSAGEWQLKQCANKDCGLIWLDPAPLDVDLYLAYQQYYTHVDGTPGKATLLGKLIQGYQASAYDYMVETSTKLSRAFGRLLSFSSFIKENMDYPFSYFANTKKGKLLELGCGSGKTLKIFKNWGWDTQGLDFDQKAVENARNKGLNVNHGDLFSQQFANHTFDAIFSSHVLEHVTDPQSLLEESYRVLKENGTFVAVMPNNASRLHQFFGANWRELDPPRHIHLFNPSSLAQLVNKTGFKEITIKTGNYSAVGVWEMSCQLKRLNHANMHVATYQRYIGQLIRFILNLTHPLYPYSGEELILIARK